MGAATEHSVRLPVDEHTTLTGDLTLPAGATSLVVFAHGSGSSRRSTRNRMVAGALARLGLGTLLFDLLTPEEAEIDARTGQLRFDVGLLSARLAAAAADIRHEVDGALGYFGASTGAAAALVAAADHPDGIGAVVSRGGRPDLVGERLGAVRAPTLLIVGGADRQVLELNRSALTRLPDGAALEVVPGATHLFEEPGALEQVAALAGHWFQEYLRPT